MNKFKFIFIFFVLVFGAVAVNAQTDVNLPVNENSLQRRPPRLAKELGLTTEQVKKIRLINRENRDKMRQANMRLRETKKSLDDAIYAETPNLGIVKARLEDFHKARAEAAEIRAMTEFEIRKILTPQQLSKFISLRRNSEKLRR